MEYHRLYPDARAIQQLFFEPVSRSVGPATSQQSAYLASEHPRPPAPTFSGGLIHTLDFDRRIDNMKQELFALERQREERVRITQDAANQSKSRAERAERRAVRFKEPLTQVNEPGPSTHSCSFGTTSQCIDHRRSTVSPSPASQGHRFERTSTTTSSRT